PAAGPGRGTAAGAWAPRGAVPPRARPEAEEAAPPREPAAAARPRPAEAEAARRRRPEEAARRRRPEEAAAARRAPAAARRPALPRPSCWRRATSALLR